MNEPSQPWVWVRRATGTALLLLAVGWAVGLTGTLVNPLVGWVAGAIGLFLGGGAWAVGRIGGAGVAAGLIGCIAAGGMAIESHRAVVATTARVVDLPSLAAWDPQSTIIAAHVSELHPLRDHRAWARVRSGSGKTAITNVQVVTPLLDNRSGDVVGFHCRGESGPEPGDGSWVLSTAAWSGSDPLDCAAGVALAVTSCMNAGIPVGEGAQTRFVEVFVTKAELRTAYSLRAALGIPLSLFAVYLVFVVALRKRGASASGIG